MAVISRVIGREILDSRGNPTVEAEVHAGNLVGLGAAPSGASTGSLEALEMRDGGERYMGKGVRNAVENINEKISKKLEGMDPKEQRNVDNAMIELDGTDNKSKLGANAMVAVSMAVASIGAMSTGIPLHKHIANIAGRDGKTLPVPMMNVINGGKHAGRENDPQEHMVMPVKANDFSSAVRMCAETYHTLKNLLKQKHGYSSTLLGDEGGFAPPISDVGERLELILKAAEEAGYSNEMYIALDPAASEFYKDGNYFVGEKKFSSGELVDFWRSLAGKYKIASIEDGFHEEDWGGWAEFTKAMGGKIQIVGDDLLVTNVSRIQTAIGKNAANALLLKVNQIGTITESIDAANLSFKNGWNVIVSHRSGETEDSFIADLSVGIDSGQCKFGAPARSDRTAKYNQLTRISEHLAGEAEYGGEGKPKV